MGAGESSCLLQDQPSGRKVQLFVGSCSSSGGGDCTAYICGKEESSHVRTARAAFDHLQAQPGGHAGSGGSSGSGALAQRHLPPAERALVEAATDEWCAALSAPGGRKLVVNGAQREVTLSTRPLALVIGSMGTFPVSFVESILLPMRACYGPSGSDAVITFGPNPWNTSDAAEGKGLAAGTAFAAKGRSGSDNSVASTDSQGRSTLRFAFSEQGECLTFVLAVRVLQLLVPELQGAAGLGRRSEAGDSDTSSRASHQSGSQREHKHSHRKGRRKSAKKRESNRDDASSLISDGSLSSLSRRLSKHRPAPLAVFSGLMAAAKAPPDGHAAAPPKRTSQPQARPKRAPEDDDGIVLKNLVSDDEEPVDPLDSPSARQARPLLPDFMRLGEQVGVRGHPLAPNAEYHRPDDSPSVRRMKKKNSVTGEDDDSDNDTGGAAKKAAQQALQAAAAEAASERSAAGSGAGNTSFRVSEEGAKHWRRFHELRRERLHALIGGGAQAPAKEQPA